MSVWRSSREFRGAGLRPFPARAAASGAPRRRAGRPPAGHRRPALPGLALPRRAARGAAGDRAKVRLALGDGRPRPHTELLWQELAPTDKQRFLRHLRPWWEVHRHRVAPWVAADIKAARARGALQIMTGQLDAIEPAAHGLAVRWRPRGESVLRELAVQRVINYSGPQTDPGRLSDPLIGQLIGAGLARPDAYGLGLDATTQGALIDRDGRPSSQLRPRRDRRGAYWEITSVPDVRTKAKQVASAALDAARRTVAATVAAGPPTP